MKEQINGNTLVTPILFPFEPETFWKVIRQIVREELELVKIQSPMSSSSETHGMSNKPLYKISEVCELFRVTKPTIYDWMRHGKLKPLKIRSRVYFLSQDIQKLMQSYKPK
ncbi:MAG: helix-turn-helix domain-containing protein [Williamsia sp.]|nr:helix-turn-helix domain-containing protein [Williamsia sp.]